MEFSSALGVLRIGAGAGFEGDRVDPARDLARRGKLDWLIFECLAERTLAYGHLARKQDQTKGYSPRLEQRVEAVLPDCRRNKTRIVTNMGAANPAAAGKVAADVARRIGCADATIAVVEGDDVTALIGPDTPLPEIGKTVGETGLRMVGANAYLGAEAIMLALETGADLVITGRVADPSLFVAPIAHRWGWSLTDWRRMGQATLVGHLLECTTQITGGYFADPGRKDVPNLAYVGFPLAEVEADGGAVIAKLPRTGGCVTELTVKEQLLYEVHDPRAYLTPDVTADFSRVAIEDRGNDRVHVQGGDGRSRPSKLKTIVGFDGGFLAEAEFSYAGPGAGARAKLARNIVRERMTNLHQCAAKMRFDLIGMRSLHATAYGDDLGDEDSVADVRLRAAMRTADRKQAETLLAEVESLWLSGPAGGGGYRGQITPSVVTYAAYVDRDAVRPRMHVVGR